MLEQTPNQGDSRASERDRVATELRYVTRRHDWYLPAEMVAPIVEWHIEAIAAARADVWVPGMAGSRDPVVEEALSRYYAHRGGAAVAQLIDENTGLRQQLLTAVACIRSYAKDETETGARAKTVLEQLLTKPHPGISHP